MRNNDRPRPRSRRATLRDLFKGKAFTLLSLLRLPLTRPLVVRAGNELAQVEIVLRPAGPALPVSGLPGRHFSPLEQLIFDAILAEKTRNPARVLVGKNIALLIKHPYDPKFKAILANLVDRDAVRRDDTLGYHIPGTAEEAA